MGSIVAATYNPTLMSKRSGGRSSRVSNGLVALSSAAVLGIYSAGYARTRPAAARIALAAERRPAPPAPSAGPLPARTAVEPPASAPPAAKGPAPVASAPTPPPPQVPRPRRRRAVQHVAVVAGVSASAPLPVVGAQALALPPAEPAAPAPPPAAPVYKDGTYYGWGTSRHGDIQAAVVIENGRIASATIAQCLTRYSCSWIAKLPPQVAERQSPEVDYVSGATQSTNAFYYAVVEALGKAK